MFLVLEKYECNACVSYLVRSDATMHFKCRVEK